MKLSKKIPSEVSNALAGIEGLERLSDTMAAHLEMRIPEKQELLEALDIRKRVNLLLGKLDGEIDLIEVEKRIRGRVKKQMERSQREYYLNEQMKAIQKEMGTWARATTISKSLSRSWRKPVCRRKPARKRKQN